MKTFSYKKTVKKKKTPVDKKKTLDSTDKNRRYRSTYLQYRCNMTGFSDSMEIYKPMLEERKDVCEQLEKTPFWSLIKLYMDHFLVVTKRKKKSDTDLIKVIKCYDPKEQKFRFGDHDARGITPDDVALIFGLNNDGVELPNTDKSSKSGKEDRFIEKYFHNVERVKQKHILEAYKKSLVYKTPEGARDTASIICAHLIQSLLFANSGSYITWSFLQICARLDEISKYNWAKGVRDYLFKMIDRSQSKKRTGGNEPTTSGCTVLILYWLCLKSNLVATIEGRENMVPAIGRWDTTMIHQAIRDVKFEDIEIAGAILPAEKTEDHYVLKRIKCSKTMTKKRKKTSAQTHGQGEYIEISELSTEKEKDSSSKAKEKTWTRKRKRTAAAKEIMEPDERSKTNEAHQFSTFDEAQQEFDKLYSEEFLKLDPDYQFHIHGIDTTITDEMFNQFEKCTGVEQRRYMVLKHMMMHAIDNLQTTSVVSGQTIGRLKRDIEKLQEEKELNKKKISDMNDEIQQLRLKSSEASAKINLLLNDIGNLNNKVQENQTKVPEVPIDDQMESREEASKDQMEDVQIQAETQDVEIAKQPEVITGQDQVQVPIDVQMDSQYVEAANQEDTSKVEAMNKDSSANLATPEANEPKDGQEDNGKEKKKTRTLVRNIRNRDDRKANVLQEFDYVPIHRNPKKKAKYIYAVSDSESPSIVISQSEQNLEQIIEREKEKDIFEEQETEKKKPMIQTEKNKKVLEKEKVKPIVDKTKEKPKVVKAKPIAKETKRKPAKKTNAKGSKTDKASYLPATTHAYKFLDDETREKIKEYYRQNEM